MISNQNQFVRSPAEHLQSSYCVPGTVLHAVAIELGSCPWGNGVMFGFGRSLLICLCRLGNVLGAVSGSTLIPVGCTTRVNDEALTLCSSQAQPALAYRILSFYIGVSLWVAPTDVESHLPCVPFSFIFFFLKNDLFIHSLGERGAHSAYIAQWYWRDKIWHDAPAPGCWDAGSSWDVCTCQLLSLFPRSCLAAHNEYLSDSVFGLKNVFFSYGTVL